MKQKKIKIILLAAFVLILLLMAVKFFSILSFPENKYIVRVERTFPTQSSSYPKTKPMKLYPGKPVIQKITIMQNNFDQINIAFDNFPKHPSDQIVLTLGDENCAPIYSRAFGFFSFLRDPIYTRFKFPKIADSAGKTFCLEAKLASKTASQEDLPGVLTFRSESDSINNSGEKKWRGEDIHPGIVAL